LGLAGGVFVTTASMTPGSVHSELAFMDFHAIAAGLVGTGTPAFRIRPAAGLQ
jgi:hypothetical protein